MLLRIVRPIVLLLGAIGLAAPAWAWGSTGHEIVDAIARDQLTDEERQQVTDLLAAAGLPDFVRVGPWADSYRIKHPKSAPWHFVDIPLAATTYDEDRDCHDDGRGHRVADLTCVIVKIEEFRQQLADKTLPAAERGTALAFLIHFVADVHQPLHASNDNDRGGNGVLVTFFGQTEIVYGGKTYPLVLHAVWDTSLIERLYGVNPEVDAVALQLEVGIGPEQRRTWCASGPIDWAKQSHDLAASTVYPKLPLGTPKVLAEEYFEAATPVVTLQLQRAGVRLACAISAALR